MNYTENYQLNQWAASDRVLREDFNADNEKIDAALAEKGDCSIVSGSYTGNGTYGPGSPNNLTFGFKPRMLLVICGSTWAIFHPGSSTSFVNATSAATVNVTWRDDGLSWCVSDSSSTFKASMQLNSSGTVYSYIAFR